MVLFLFLVHLGVGIAFTLLLVSREAGVKFFRFNAGLAAILIAVALAFRYQGSMPSGGGSSFAHFGLLTLEAAEAALVVYWATVGRTFARIRPAIVAMGVGGGVLAVTLQALAVTVGRAFPMRVLTVASFLSSAALLGGACTAMILGHWYLVIPSLQIRHLQSMVKVHIVSMVVRIVVVAAAVFGGIALGQPGPGGPGGSVASFRHYIMSIDGIFFWQRVLFGLAGPSLLSYLTWETAKIRSTQSATGILYVDFFTVVVGEVLAKYLLLATQVPV